MTQQPMGNVPIPDPTTLTIELTEREIKHARELREMQIAWMREVADLKHEHLKELAEQRAVLNAKALEAAFAAQKEVAGRVEETFEKQLDPLKEKLDDLASSAQYGSGSAFGRSSGFTDLRVWVLAALALVPTLILIFSR